jgi:hypothetical protein
MPNILSACGKYAFLATGEHLGGWRRNAIKSTRLADFAPPDAPKLIDFARFYLYYECLRFIS